MTDAELERLWGDRMDTVLALTRMAVDRGSSNPNMAVVACLMISINNKLDDLVEATNNVWIHA